MRWLPNISFSSSSAGSSSSFRSSPSRRGPEPDNGSTGKRSSVVEDENIGASRARRFGSRIRLTRQRKLRHLSDRELSGLPKWSDSQWGLRQCSSSYDRLPARSSSTSAIPQPLPLPETSPVARRREGFVGSSFDCPLPSPKDSGPTKGVEVDRDKDRVDHGAGDGVSASPKTHR